MSTDTEPTMVINQVTGEREPYQQIMGITKEQQETLTKHLSSKEVEHYVQNLAGEILSSAYTDLMQLIDYSFTWSDTPEGHGYWATIAHRDD